MAAAQTKALLLCKLFLANRCTPVPEVSNALPDSVLATDGITIHYICMVGHIYNNGGDIFSVTCNSGSWVYNESIQCIRKLTLLERFTDNSCIWSKMVCR